MFRLERGIKPDWWTRKAFALLKNEHVFVITYHYCPYAHYPPYAMGGLFVRKYGIYNTQTGMRVYGFGRITFEKVRRRLNKRPALIPMRHPPYPSHLRRRDFPPDKVYTLK